MSCSYCGQYGHADAHCPQRARHIADRQREQYAHRPRAHTGA
eukprot:gene43243-10424_t